MTPEQQNLRDALAALPGRVAEAAGRLTDPDEPVAPGDWSAREVVLHLAAVDQEVWQPRLDALVAEDLPRFTWAEPGTWSGPGAETFEGAAAVLATFRAATIERLDALDEVGWARRGIHATLGDIDVAALMRIAQDHDAEHLAQIPG
ncbi:MAG: DinB family protein [Chloroflexota bacterium]